MKRALIVLVVMVIFVVAVSAVAALRNAGAGGETTRVSVASDGTQGNGDSWYAVISADGTIVAYDSDATTLVPDDANGQRDVFIYDRASGTTSLISLASDDTPGNALSEFPTLSADGRIVVYHSHATTLVNGDTNGAMDVFAYDRDSGETTRLSVSSVGTQGNGRSERPVPSADGRTVVFRSDASNLTSDDTNNASDIFVHDRETGTTTRVSVTSEGAQADGDSAHPVLSADGRLVAFDSVAANLVNGDTNGASDVFVHDRETGITTRVSIASGGAQSDGASREPAISGDGSTLAFVSDATNLVNGDSNGVSDIFSHDIASAETVRVSVAGSGAGANDRSLHPSISGDGVQVAFHSFASNLVGGDTNDASDIFIHDRLSGRTVRVSVATDGAQGDHFAFDPSLSANGRIVTYSSDSTNLVSGDSNGRFDVFVYEQTRQTFLPALMVSAP